MKVNFRIVAHSFKGRHLLAGWQILHRTQLYDASIGIALGNFWNPVMQYDN